MIAAAAQAEAEASLALTTRAPRRSHVGTRELRRDSGQGAAAPALRRYGVAFLLGL